MQRCLLTIFIGLALCLLYQLGHIKAYKSCHPPLPCPAEASEAVVEKTHPDLKILCKAIAVAETSGCTTGSALSSTNCHGITSRKGGYVKYQNFEQSFAACEDLWARKYVRFPDWDLAARWSSPGAASGWLLNVRHVYMARMEAKVGYTIRASQPL